MNDKSIRLIQHQTILHKAAEVGPVVAFQADPPEDDQFVPPSGEPGPVNENISAPNVIRLGLPRETWEDLGSPDTITVTVAGGDHLNESRAAQPDNASDR